MSQLKQLSILGFRAFDNQQSEAIEFFTPLTLIVGTNGSGKTTIIECLKYATMGDMPPNTKGGAFIHDPKICGEKEVMAQVKLLFYGITRARMVATRSAQLTAQKNGRVTMKTLDGNLLMQTASGDRTSLSHKQAELDDIIPKFLGAGPAILDNVIFCHQDESLWPLSEPSSLKKKFDEIFEAQKYTKAIDRIKVLRKTKNEELNQLIITETQAKADKERGKKLEQQRDQLAREIEQMKVTQRDLYNEIQEFETEREEATQKYDKFRTIVADTDRLHLVAKEKRQAVQFLKSQIGSGMSESDSELTGHLEAFEERAKSRQEQVDSHTRRYRELDQKIEGIRSDMSGQDTALGEAKGEQRSYERHLEDRAVLVKETAHAHNIRGYDSDLDEHAVREFSTKLSRLSKDQNAALDRARHETAQDLGEIQKVLDSHNMKKSSLNQSKQSAQSQISENDTAMSRKQDEAFRIDVDEGKHATLESSVAETQTKLERIKSEFESAGWDKKISEVNVKVKQFEEKAAALRAELLKATAQIKESAHIDLLKKSSQENRKALETMKGAHDEKLGVLFGKSWSPANLEQSYLRSLEDKVESLREAERQRDGLGLELESAKRKLTACRSDIKFKRDSRKSSSAKILATFQEMLGEEAPSDPSDFEEELERLEKNRDILKSDMDSMTASADYFKQCLETLKSAHVCRLCERSFSSNKELEKLESKLKKFVSPDALKSVREDHESTEAQLKQLRSLQPTYNEWKRLKTEIGEHEKMESSLAAEHDQLTQRAEKHDSVVADRLDEKREVESFAKTVQTITKYHLDITNHDKQIEELAAKQSQGGLMRGHSEINEEYDFVTREGQEAKEQLAKLTADRESRKDLINSTQWELSQTHSDLSKVANQLREKASIEKQMQELRDRNKDLREKIKQYERDAEKLGPQISQSQEKYDDIARRGEAKEKELQALARKLNDSVNQLRLAEREITVYLENDGAEKVRRAERAIEQLKKDIAQKQSERNNVGKTIKSLEDQMVNEKENKRQIQDNLTYRRDQRALQEVESQISELEDLNAHSDKDRWQNEKERLGAEINVRVASQQSLLGEMKTKDGVLAEKIEEYDDQYADAANRYKEVHITVEVTRAAIEDLGRYGQALDKAIMTYHALKMEEINRIIEELWRQTYRGTDVDTILIKSDSDNESTGRSTKSYNYRVCMVKQDVEMDMRGRCSAGQKVLASIIIRLALAECFGLSCGVIALDEPTTNLDRDNIVSLAESIHRIIQARKSQKNFQLIVITHDEDFLRAMRCSDFTDYYYRVQRSPAQKSEIIKQSIHALE